MAEQGLFSDELLSPEVQAALPQGYKLRALRRSDFDAGYLDCLRVLTTVGDITKEQFEDRYDWMARQDNSYYVLVIEDTNSSPPRIVGTGALLRERKL
jgi:glucosamine-phosphate N-acetyltransferase